ncbi:hypothetical protein GCM10010412_100450 [Nonomuraea recticatena]|uniref:Transposase n=1 Tax=Nonomuraea recticatena TaxID=46178 RepID=A0ABN3TES8_9ACTN
MVRTVRETGKPVSHVAQALGINEYTLHNSLHNWVQMDRLADVSGEWQRLQERDAEGISTGAGAAAAGEGRAGQAARQGEGGLVVLC